MPAIDKLIALHKKYCSGDKSIEELQRDLYCFSDDFNRLELCLQTGVRSAVHYWSEIEDLILTKHFMDEHSEELNMLWRIKGPEEIVNRKYFLKLLDFN